MKASDLGQNWSKKVDMYIDMAADLTNQSKEGFKNRDASGTVKHAFKESAERLVAALLGEEPNPADEDHGPEYCNESVKAAAVKTHDGTVIAGPPGADHIAAAQMANQAGKTWDDEGLGFVTDDGKFVTRAEAEIIGMAHGQMKSDISDPGMVHARDFNWNESADRPYRYEINCVGADGANISDMIDQATDITYQEFVRKVPLSAIFDSGIGYNYYWTPAQAIVAGVDYYEVKQNHPLTLEKDWHVSYHRSTYQGKPCYFMVHSAIEYVFVRD
jgi:hypothetical protein